ncbi:MAG: VacJ family lipoprotein [Smithellaceae bacterium]
MKTYLLSIFLFIFLAAGPVHGSDPIAAPANAEASQAVVTADEVNEPVAETPKTTADPFEEEYENGEYADAVTQEEGVEIADPLEPFNRVIFQFNDKLYFWMLKPVAQGYKEVVPEPARISIKNFFTNLGFPIRFLSCLLQADFSGAATEAGRFGVNTIWGIGGLMDPASSKELDLKRQDTDLGLTLASYGVGHGFYLVWPVFGPSSPRDTIDLVGKYFLNPMSYVTPWYYPTGTKVVEVVNRTSLSIGDYESLKEAAIDPYVAMRDAYIQYRKKQIKRKNNKAGAAGVQLEQNLTKSGAN